MDSNPFSRLVELANLGEDFFGDLNNAGSGKGTWPPVDVFETDSEVIVEVAVPGLSKSSDVRLELRGNTLVLEGELSNQGPRVAAREHHRERRHGKFTRSISLPAVVRSGQATYQHGILEIRLPKTDTQAETLKVDFLR